MAAGLSSFRWVTITAGLLVAVALAGLVVCLLALARQGEARRLLVDRLDPATIAALRLDTALLNEETGVRGYVLEARPTFLQPYTGGRAAEQAALRRLEGFSREEGVVTLADDLREVRTRADAWRTGYAEPAVSAARAGEFPPMADVGRGLFDRVRVALRGLQDGLSRERAGARERLDDTARRATWSLVAVMVLIVVAGTVTGIVLRRVVGAPVGRLARQVRAVADGAFAQPIVAGGAYDVEALGRDVERMRERIVQELDTVERARERLISQAQELERSNSELEQFAYVASHDLQEPLRKVASFCQALERRYGDQLDDRAKQYIAFAVDGAKRMQVLINDLLAFSRVGRQEGPQELVDLDDLVADAQRNLATAMEETGARVVVDGDLPVVRGDATLLTLVFQNLLGNAIKFRGEAAPEVRVGTARDGDHFTITCADNGIGINTDYADRIFVIFQRLHPKEAYPGTGIGLAMCRKIVEHHGGRIWLEPAGDGAPGATFRLTLPVPPDPEPT